MVVATPGGVIHVLSYTPTDQSKGPIQVAESNHPWMTTTLRPSSVPRSSLRVGMDLVQDLRVGLQIATGRLQILVRVLQQNDQFFFLFSHMSQKLQLLTPP